MNASRLVRHVHVLWRSERIIAELRLKRLLGSMGLQALAALMASPCSCSSSRPISPSCGSGMRLPRPPCSAWSTW
jgi:hypothetical protein